MARKILVVDSDSRIRQLVRNYLEREGYDIAEARDGVEALEVVEEWHPDLIVLADVLPRKSGLDVMGELQASQATDGIPVVMLASTTDDAKTLEAWRSGISAHLKKPFNPKEMLAFVERIFESLDRGPS